MTKNTYCSVKTTSLLVAASLQELTAIRYFSSAWHLESLNPLCNIKGKWPFIVQLQRCQDHK